MTGNYRARLIKLFTFFGGIYFFLEFMLPGEIAGVRVDAYHDQISQGFIVIGAMAVGLGLINLLRVHGSKIVFARQGAFFSTALLLGLAGMMAITTIDWLRTLDISKEAGRLNVLSDFALVIVEDGRSGKGGVPPLELRRTTFLESADAELAPLAGEELGGALEAELLAVQVSLADVRSGALDEWGHYESSAAGLSQLAAAKRELLQESYNKSRIREIYQFFYMGLFVPLGAAMFSLLGFYIATAAYRAFRIRSFESGLMMSAAVIVMLGQIPFGLWLWEGLPALRMWLLAVPSTAAFRAIEIGASVAGLVIAFRMWFSIESESFSEKAQEPAKHGT